MQVGPYIIYYFATASISRPLEPPWGADSTCWSEWMHGCLRHLPEPDRRIVPGSTRPLGRCPWLDLNTSPPLIRHVERSETSPGEAGMCSLSGPIPASPGDSSQARNDDWVDVRQSLDLCQATWAAAWSKDIQSDGPLGIGEIRLRTSEALFVVSKCRPVKGPLSTGTRASQGAC